MPGMVRKIYLKVNFYTDAPNGCSNGNANATAYGYASTRLRSLTRLPNATIRLLITTPRLPTTRILTTTNGRISVTTTRLQTTYARLLATTHGRVLTTTTRLCCTYGLPITTRLPNATRLIRLTISYCDVKWSPRPRPWSRSSHAPQDSEPPLPQMPRYRLELMQRQVLQEMCVQEVQWYWH